MLQGREDQGAGSGLKRGEEDGEWRRSDGGRVWGGQVRRSAGVHYVAKRLPAYTDRIQAARPLSLRARCAVADLALACGAPSGEASSPPSGAPPLAARPCGVCLSGAETRGGAAGPAVSTSGAPTASPPPTTSRSPFPPAHARWRGLERGADASNALAAADSVHARAGRSPPRSRPASTAARVVAASGRCVCCHSQVAARTCESWGLTRGVVTWSGRRRARGGRAGAEEGAQALLEPLPPLQPLELPGEHRPDPRAVVERQDRAHAH
eukprot:3509106-Rhodomonas_salina.3